MIANRLRSVVRSVAHLTPQHREPDRRRSQRGAQSSARRRGIPRVQSAADRRRDGSARQRVRPRPRPVRGRRLFRARGSAGRRAILASAAAVGLGAARHGLVPDERRDGLGLDDQSAAARDDEAARPQRALQPAAVGSSAVYHAGRGRRQRPLLAQHRSSPHLAIRAADDPQAAVGCAEAIGAARRCADVGRRRADAEEERWHLRLNLSLAM